MPPLTDPAPEPRWRQVWPEFSKQLEEKLQRGYEEHTDASFARMPEELVKELLEECIDIAGWSMVLYPRIRSLLPHLEYLRAEFAALDQAIVKIKAARDVLESSK